MTDAPANALSAVRRAFAAVHGPPQARLPAPPLAAGRAADAPLPVGVDAHRFGEGWHLVTAGLADVRPAGDGPTEPLGQELTVIVPAADRPPEWAFSLLLGTARTSVAVGRAFHAGARLAPGAPLDGGDSGLVAVGLRDDPLVTVEDGPTLLQAVGVTNGEFLLMQRVGTLVVLERLAARDPLLRTDPSRA
ncbi:suppressor of fused domain protein [Patulibacter americanus]|uniref:suppressor of fused domain protein n=1 Tax=Patulibacter americanus TaxID=588672 RepID=UPI0003B5D370|nr:suppressor of fused domain protein [Patulibacter americanus]